jgi:hypothetical protein
LAEDGVEFSFFAGLLRGVQVSSISSALAGVTIPFAPRMHCDAAQGVMASVDKVA